MKRVIPIIFAVLVIAGGVIAQSGVVPVAATPQQRAEFKVLQEAETKALAAFTAAREKLPEFAAFKEAERKLLEASERLPEKSAFNRANAESWDAAYRFLAQHQLSSREYEPALDAKGQLEFRKKQRP